MEKAIKARIAYKLTIKQKSTISFIISLLFVFIYSYTGIDKLGNIDKFSRGISKIPYVGGMHVWIGWGVPLLELLISALLIIPGSNQLGLKLATSLMAVFTAYLALMLAFAEKRMCHCGGVIESMGWVEHFLFNIVFTLLGGYALYLNKNINHKI